MSVGAARSRDRHARIPSVADYKPIDMGIRRQMARPDKKRDAQKRPLPKPPQPIGALLVWLAIATVCVLAAVVFWGAMMLGAALLLQALGG